MDIDPNPGFLRQEDTQQLSLIPTNMFPFQSPIFIPTPPNKPLLHPNANSHHFHDTTLLNGENIHINPALLMEPPLPPPPTSFTTHNVSPFFGVSTFSLGESSSHNNPDLFFTPNNSPLECTSLSTHSFYGHNPSGGDNNKNIIWDFEQKVAAQSLSPLGGVDLERGVLVKRIKFEENISCIIGNNNDLQGKLRRRNKTSKMKNGINGNNNIIKGQWSPDEDCVLAKLVNQYGPRKWAHIATMVNGRTGKQCRERYYNHLKLDIKKGPWTLEEDKALIEAHKKVGKKMGTNSSKIVWKDRKCYQESLVCHQTMLSRIVLSTYIKSVTRDEETMKVP